MCQPDPAPSPATVSARGSSQHAAEATPAVSAAMKLPPTSRGLAGAGAADRVDGSLRMVEFYNP
jgi:hypothetical protein